MPTPRHLRSAPITEGLFDFRVKARPGINALVFREIHATLRDRYPKQVEQRAFMARFEVAGEGPPAASNRELGLHGVHFKSEDEKTIVQFRVDGFTLNRLSPYTSWEELLPEALRVWHLYVSVAQPLRVIRVAVRNINRLLLNGGIARINEVLISPPGVPNNVTMAVTGFLHRVTVHDESLHNQAHVTLATEPTVEPGRDSLLFDIDAFREVDLDPADQSLSPLFAALRTLKNRLFFGHLTESVVRSFE